MRTLLCLLLASLLASACDGGPPRPTPSPTPTQAIPTATPTPVVLPTPIRTPPAGLTLTLSSAEGTVGQTVVLELVLWNAATLAGYDVVVRVEDPAVARIASVPLKGVMELLPEPPGPEVRIRYVDVLQVLTHPTASLTTVEVELLDRGETMVTVEVLRLDDRAGDPLTARVFSGMVIAR